MLKMPEGVSNKDDLEFNDSFVQAYDALENSSNNVFLTGRAGTGKSTLLQYFRDNTVKGVVVLAPTGVAAVNVKGQTIHSFFRFKPDVTPESVPLIKLRKKQIEIYKKCMTIIIDEISMVRADLLDCVDIFLRIYGNDSQAPFGGIQMIFIGDPYQLPPVVPRSDKELFNGHYASPYFFDAKIFAELDMQMIELDKVYRQKDDGFVKLLNTIRNKTAEDKHLKLLNQRYNPQFKPSPHDFYIHLTTTNAMADSVNKEHLNRLSTESETFEGDLLGDFAERSLPTHLSLTLKVGAQVMLLNNDSLGRWVNGSIGKIVSLSGIDGNQAIRVELSGGAVVEITPFTWEVFRFFFDEEAKMIDSENVGSFMQYPVRLAWAVTIHKSQGKTFTKVVVDIGRGTFAHGQAYVALSRCTHFEGLILKKPILRHHIILDQNVVAFMQKYNNLNEIKEGVKDDRDQNTTQLVKS